MRKKTYAQKLEKIKHYYLSNPKLSDSAKVEMFLKEFKIRKYPIDIAKLLINMGFKIFVVEGLNCTSNLRVTPSSCKETQFNKVICINKRLSYEERRVAIVRELFYYLFYFDDDIDLKYFHSTTSIFNLYSLDAFVSELLAPSNLISKYYKKYEKKFKYSSKLTIKNKVANYFEVPLKLIENRL